MHAAVRSTLVGHWATDTDKGPQIGVERALAAVPVPSLTATAPLPAHPAMGFRFHRRIRLMPGVRLNIGKRGVSTSIGARGAWLTFRPGHKVRTTVGLPGTGISYTEGGQVQRAHPADPARPARAGSAARGLLFIVLLIGAVPWWAFSKST
jgi:hypothetical protein